MAFTIPRGLLLARVRGSYTTPRDLILVVAARTEEKSAALVRNPSRGH